MTHAQRINSWIEFVVEVLKALARVLTAWDKMQSQPA